MMFTDASSAVVGGAAQHDRRPLRRLARLLDAGSPVPLDDHGDSAVVAARGRINGAPVLIYCVEENRIGGALGAANCSRVAGIIERAVSENTAVIAVWHPTGADLAGDAFSLDGFGRICAAMTCASGKVAQVSILLGPSGGAPAFAGALSDIVISSAGAVPGGAQRHAHRCGQAHVVVDSEAEAWARARRIVTLLTRPGDVDLRMPAATGDPRTLLPDSPRRAYDMRPLVRRLLDEDVGDGGFEELQSRWAPNVLIGLGRLAGRTVGVVANNPLRKGGCLDCLGTEKAARFVRMCDSLGIPLLVLVDVPGYLPGAEQEWSGVVRRGAKLLHAFAESVVPRVTLIIRKAYGGAYIAMNSRALGATAVFAWPGAEVAVMGAESAVDVLHRKKLAAAAEEERSVLRVTLAEEFRRSAGGIGRAVEIGAIDEVIEPVDTRRRLAEVLTAAPAVRGRHANIPL